jgi:HTH-type transcriptional regulator / antitoxin HipB
VDYPLKTVSQLRPTLLGFRKKAGLTQEKVAQQLGISQQSYAAFEAHPESASVDRLFRVLRLFAVEMRLSFEAAPMPAITAQRKVPQTRTVAPSPSGASAGTSKRKATAAPTARTARPAAAKKHATTTRAKPRKREDW